MLLETLKQDLVISKQASNMSGYKIVSFSPKTFELFKVELKKAIKDSKEFLTFQNDEYLVSYAKHLVEYLQPKFDKLKH
jgi:hypothetical protein